MAARVDRSALKAAELLSTAGATALGGGLALLWPRLADFAVPLLVVGLLVHAVGMALKQRLQRGDPQPRWHSAMEWVCWLAMAGLIAFLGWRITTG
jgi:hypothetical protein